MKKIVALLIVFGFLLSTFPMLSPQVEASVYNYDITTVTRTGSTEVTVKLQVQFCGACNPNYLSSPGCFAFVHGYPPPYYPYSYSCGGSIDGRYVAVRLKDLAGNILGTQRLVCNPTNWPLNQLVTRDFVFLNIPLAGLGTVIAEADVYCSWCGHWYPSPKSLEVAPLRVCIDPGHGGTDQGTLGYGDFRYFQYPLDTWDVTQEFGNWYEAWGGYHLAEDVSAMGGTEVHAAADGVVKFAQFGIGDYGGVIVIEHTLPDSTKVCSVYGHLSQKLGFKVSTKSGKNNVEKGQPIGYLAYADEPGGQYGTHLHFGIREGAYVDGAAYYFYDTRQGIWRWTWAYIGYTRNANVTTTTKTDYDVTHEQMKEMWWNPYEKSFSLDVGLRLKDLLEGQDIEVVMTRTADTNVTPEQRCDIANNNDCAVFISIHCNSHADQSATGAETCYYPGSTNGLDLARHVQSELIKQVGLADLGTKGGTCYVLEYAEMPAAATEVAGLNNQYEFSLLNDPAFRQKAAQGIANGILGYLEGKGLTIAGYSPIDIVVTDPDGLTLSKQANEIPGATYNEIDLDGDGDLDDQIRIPDRKLGEYTIAVIPEADALPTDTYTLEVSLFGVPVVIARNMPISEIPSEPYVVVSTETGIIPPTVAATVDFDPDTLNLKTRDKYVTVYIEPPPEYDVGQIDISSIRLNDTLPALTKPTQVGDYDKDGIRDLMVKFDGSAVKNMLTPGDQVEMTISGDVAGIAFEGTDTIRVIDPTWYSLDISSTTGGSVTVPGEGTFSYKGGTVVSLVAVPASCYHFVNWTGDVSTIANVTAASTTITMNTNHSITANFEEEVVTFPDPNLEAAIREAIGKPTGPIYCSDLKGLTSIGAVGRNIANLTGLEHCTSLIYLYLFDNQIDDISLLSTLTGLTHLGLSCNQINDISPLSTLTSLTDLDLDGNPIGDISPLSTLTGLKELWLVDNQINDISPLSTLTSLTRLSLAANQINDISPLSTLTGLTELYLGANQINDISPLSTLTSLRVLYIYMNQIDDISPLSTLTGLTDLDLTANQINDISPLSTLTSLTYLSLWDNQISDVSPLVENAGLSEGDYVNLDGNPLSSDSINIYIPQLQARGVTVDY